MPYGSGSADFACAKSETSKNVCELPGDVTVSAVLAPCAKRERKREKSCSDRSKQIILLEIWLSSCAGHSFVGMRLLCPGRPSGMLCSGL